MSILKKKDIHSLPFFSDINMVTLNFHFFIFYFFHFFRPIPKQLSKIVSIIILEVSPLMAIAMVLLGYLWPAELQYCLLV